MPLLIKGDRKAQYEFYRLLAPKLLGVAYRYLKNNTEQEDVLQEAFILIFKNLNTYKGDSKIETWATRILINVILQKINSDKKASFVDVDDSVFVNEVGIFNTESNFLYEELIKLINMLPEAKKLIFNLFVLEGYSHKEISEMLNISESTSKTQLFRAKELLVELHKKINKVGA